MIRAYLHIYWWAFFGLHLTCMGGSLGQQIPIKSTVVLHFDRPFYVAGEIINYTLYLPPNISEQQPMVAMTWYDQQGLQLARTYLRDPNTTSLSGWYKVPFEAEAGVYRLRATIGQPTKDHELLLIEAKIPLYSESLLDNAELGWTAVLPPIPDQLSELTVKVEHKGSITPREHMTVTLLAQDNSGVALPGRASISVVDSKLLRVPYFQSVYTNELLTSDLGPLDTFIQLKGNLKSKANRILLTFTLKDQLRILNATTNDQGVFYLELPDVYGNQEVQYVAEFNQGEQVEWETYALESLPAASLVLTEDIKRYLEESRRRKVIYQLYNQIPDVPKLLEMESGEQALPADLAIIAKNYSFSHLSNFCRELATPLKYQKNKAGEWAFQMFNPGTRDMLVGHPLFIIDGQITKNSEYLNSLDFQKFERIELYFLNETIADRFGSVGFSGVVVITSKDGKMPVPNAYRAESYQISGLQIPLEFTQNLPETANIRQPALRPQLYWQGHIDVLGTENLIYQQSDDRTEYLIEVIFQSQDGRIGYRQQRYIVQ